MEKHGTTRTAIERHQSIRFWPCPQAPTHPSTHTHTTTTILTQAEWGQTRVCITRYEIGVDSQIEFWHYTIDSPGFIQRNECFSDERAPSTNNNNRGRVRVRVRVRVKVRVRVRLFSMVNKTKTNIDLEFLII